MGLVKQVIVVRKDLNMGAGKIAAQVGHACVLGAEHVRKSHPQWYKDWEMAGQEKVVVKVANLDELEKTWNTFIDDDNNNNDRDNMLLPLSFNSKKYRSKIDTILTNNNNEMNIKSLDSKRKMTSIVNDKKLT